MREGLVVASCGLYFPMAVLLLASVSSSTRRHNKKHGAISSETREQRKSPTTTHDEGIRQIDKDLLAKSPREAKKKRFSVSAYPFRPGSLPL